VKSGSEVTQVHRNQHHSIACLSVPPITLITILYYYSTVLILSAPFSRYLSWKSSVTLKHLTAITQGQCKLHRLIHHMTSYSRNYGARLVLRLLT